MLNSVELRAPILDKELARIAFSLDDSTKISKGETKIPLRRIVEEEFGMSVCTLRKTGFGVNFGELLNYLKKSLEADIDKFDQLGLDRDAVQRMLEPMQVVNNSKRIYALYSLLVWKVWGAGRDVSNVLI
jgi:asparagine synthase (glutamine-hydrolysing)